ATPVAGSPRAATPAAGVPTAVQGEHVSAPGTFLGLAVAPRAQSQAPVAPSPLHEQSQSSVVAAVPARIRRGTIAIIGFGVLTVIVVIAIVASRGRAAGGKTGDGSVAKEGSEIQIDPALEIVDHANSLINSGEREAAIELLQKSRKDYPDSGALPYALGR